MSTGIKFAVDLLGLWAVRKSLRLLDLQDRVCIESRFTRQCSRRRRKPTILLNMDTVTVLFPADEAGTAPIAEFADDFRAASLFPVFEPLLFDLNRAINNCELVLRGTRRDRYAPIMYSGPRLRAEQFRELYQAIEDRHWRMVTDHYVYGFNHYHYNVAYVHVVNEPYLAIPEMAIGGVSQYAIDQEFPQGFALKDLDAQSPRFLERVSTPIDGQWYRDIVAQRGHVRFGEYAANLIAQGWVNLKRYAGATNEWRMRYFGPFAVWCG